jgi:hypothetical protein
MGDLSVKFFEILETLVEHQIEFIVIGGVCAALHGATLPTFDLDVVHSRKSENIKRLLETLQSLEAIFREPGNRRIVPKASNLVSDGHQLLMTRFGPLDLLGTISDGRGYEELFPHTVEYQVDHLKIRLLDLPTLIDIKKETGRNKDKAMLPILKQVLAEKQKIEGRAPDPQTFKRTKKNKRKRKPK